MMVEEDNGEDVGDVEPGQEDGEEDNRSVRDDQPAIRFMLMCSVDRKHKGDIKIL